MKRTFKLFQICLLICGVIGVDADEVKTVMEGDSVTLNSHLNQTQGIILILWRFGDKGSTIAQIDGKDISYPKHTEIFGDRLLLDQTGSLTIKNMRTKHSGLYKLQIDHNTGTSRIAFNVTVSESPPVTDVGEAEMKSVPVKEGDPVILQTVTETQGDELIVWRFGDKGKLIAKRDIETKNSKLYETDERFRDRLKLNDQTGSLTITNIRTTDSGVYRVKISSNNKQTIYKRFSVIVSAVADPGLSSGAVAGIVVGVLLGVFSAAGVLYFFYRRKISELERQNLVSVSVKEGNSVTLNTDVDEIQRDDQIEWRFGNGGPLIAQIKGGTSTIYNDVLDGRFRGRLKLDKKTGYLTIRNTRTTDSGLYELQISRDSEIKHKKFSVSVCARDIYVEEGKSVTLNTDTEIQSYDRILWMCGENLIAQIKGGAKEMFDDDSGGRFRGRLELDEKTGSLTIKDMRIEESGLYKLQIISSRGTTDKRFFVTVNEKQVSVYEGDPAILETGTEIHREDQILWLFKENRIAEIKGGIREITCDGADGRFKDRLELDETTGSLTITDTRTTDSGDYKLQIKSSSGVSYKKIRLHVGRRMISVEEGKPVTLETKAEIQTDDHILWTFEDTVIVQMTGEPGGKYDDAKGIFKDRLELDKTGSLTITNMRTEHSGVYKLQISSSRGTLNKTFKVVVVYDGCDTKTVMGGEDVTLPSSTYIEVNEIVQWLFEDETLAIGMDGDINKTPYFNERFRDRLQLDHQTGSLTIKNIRTSDDGHYRLKLLRCGIERKFRVTVSERDIYVEEGKNVTLNNDTEIQRDDLILWMCGENRIAQIKGGTKEMLHNVSGGRFKGRLELDETTGSLTIKDIRIEESGLYKLQIISSRGNTDKRFFVTVNERDIYVREEESVTLNNDTEIQSDDLILWMCGEKLIAQIKGGAKEMFDDVSDGRFKGRLELDETTGSLTIKDIRTDESGLYKLHIISSRGNTNKRFVVNVSVSNKKAPPIPSPLKLKAGSTEHTVNESASVLKPQSDREIPDGAKESVTVVMPLLSDVNEQQETSSL